MNDPVLVEDVSFEFDEQRWLSKLRIADQPDHADAARGLADQARAVARPRGLFGIAFITDRQHGEITIDAVRFASRVLTVNLDEVHRVFPFVATCGREMYEWSATLDDMLEQYWADTLMEMALRSAVDATRRRIEERFAPGQTSTMSPGSLADWPIEQQRPLFDLLGDVRGRIGVELTESCLMVPIKSLSALCFPTEVRFESCQLCPRDLCPGRRAPYDAGLYGRRYDAPAE